MKRTLQRLTTACLATLLIFLGGCDLTSLNENPNAPTTVDPPKLLANAQLQIADTYWQDYAGGFWVRYAQYWTTNQYTDADRYRYASSRPGGLNDLWEEYYLALNDLEQIKRLNNQEPAAQAGFGANANQKAIATIMQAWTLKIMTDMWGPVPFDKALSGRDGKFSPQYDSQRDVYAALDSMLAKASSMIKPGGTALAGGDIVYGGDMSKWKKFANALRMRTAITAADKSNPPFDVATVLKEAANAGAFASNADNALLPFNTSPPWQNPFYENRIVSGRKDWAAPKSIVSTMKAQNDPRLSAYFKDAKPSVKGDQFVGFPYGLPQGDAQSLFTAKNFSVPSDRVASTADAPAILMTYDEVLFIKAEAEYRGIDVSSKSGEELYREAVEQSALYWGATASKASSLASRVPSPGQNSWRQELGTQKWLAQYLQGVEGWTTFRRLDFTGVLQPPAGDPGQAQFGCSFPTRMVYPNDESSLNEKNLNNAIQEKLGGGGASGDNQGVLLWWDTTKNC